MSTSSQDGKDSPRSVVSIEMTLAAVVAAGAVPNDGSAPPPSAMAESDGAHSTSSGSSGARRATQGPSTLSDSISGGLPTTPRLRGDSGVESVAAERRRSLFSVGSLSAGTDSIGGMLRASDGGANRAADYVDDDMTARPQSAAELEAQVKQLEEAEAAGAHVDADTKVHHEADEWLDRQANMPALLRWLYLNIFLCCVDEDDTFELVVRKLMICAGFLYAPCSVAFGAYWISLLFTEPNSTQWTARLVAGIFAIAVGVGVFIPAYLYIRWAKKAAEGIMNFWILAIALGFMGISVGVPRFPTPTAMYALSEASILVRCEQMWLHIVCAIAVYGVTSYNLLFLSLPDSWATAALAARHEGSSAENLLLTLLGAFIVVLMAGALFLNHIEFVKLVNRSSSTAKTSRAISHAIQKFDMQAIRTALTEYKRETFADPQFFNEMVNIVRAINDLAKFSSKEIVANMLAKGGVRAGLETRDCTVFFSDIANFTTFVDQCADSSSDVFVSLMTLYFSVCSRILQQHGVLTVKYIGDALMSYSDQKNHQLMSLCAALAVQSAIKRVLRKRFEDQAAFFLCARIGLHCGESSIGVVGSKTRLQFDVIGAVPTLASRLEGLGKHVSSRLTVSEELLSATLVNVGDVQGGGNGSGSSGNNGVASANSETAVMPRQIPLFAARRVGLITVKGRLAPTAVYSVLGILPEAESIIALAVDRSSSSATGTGPGLNDSLRTDPEQQRRRGSVSSAYNSDAGSASSGGLISPAKQRNAGAAAESAGKASLSPGDPHPGLLVSDNSVVTPGNSGGALSTGADSSTGLSTALGGSNGGGRAVKILSVRRALRDAAFFARVNPAVCMIVDDINRAQELYERAQFADAARLIDMLLASYRFPDQDDHDGGDIGRSGGFSDFGSVLESTSLPAAAADDSAHRVSISSVARPFTDSAQQQQQPSQPGAVPASTQAGIARQPSLFSSKTPAPHRVQDVWPPFLIESLVDHALLSSLASRYHQLAASPPVDFDPTVVMNEK